MGQCRPRQMPATSAANCLHTFKCTGAAALHSSRLIYKLCAQVVCSMCWHKATCTQATRSHEFKLPPALLARSAAAAPPRSGAV